MIVADGAGEPARDLAKLRRGGFATGELLAIGGELGDVEDLALLAFGAGDLLDEAGDEPGMELGDVRQENALHVGEVGAAAGFLVVESLDLGFVGQGARGDLCEDGRGDQHGEDGDDGVHGVEVGREQAELDADDGDDDVRAAFEVEADTDRGRLPDIQAPGTGAEEAEEDLEQADGEEQQEECL